LKKRRPRQRTRQFGRQQRDSFTNGSCIGRS
jgi:hypothetical protein